MQMEWKKKLEQPYLDLKTETTKGQRRALHYGQGSIQEEDRALVNIYVPNTRTPTHKADINRHKWRN